MNLALHLLLASSILLCCNVIKGVLNHYTLHYIPHTGVCMAIGIILGCVSYFCFQEEEGRNGGWEFNGEPYYFVCAFHMKKNLIIYANPL